MCECTKEGECYGCYLNREEAHERQYENERYNDFINSEKEKYRKIIHGHIHLDRPLNRKIIDDMLREFPELSYSGKAYRVLSFSSDCPPVDISEDLSFSSSFLSAIRFATSLDHNFVHLYEANIKGLDLIRVSEVLGECSAGDTVSRENEIIALKVYETSLIFSGNFDEFYKKYIKGVA